MDELARQLKLAAEDGLCENLDQNAEVELVRATGTLISALEHLLDQASTERRPTNRVHGPFAGIVHHLKQAAQASRWHRDTLTCTPPRNARE